VPAIPPLKKWTPPTSLGCDGVMKAIHVLRKPCSESTVAGNVLRFGTGAINVDATRVDGRPRTTHADGNYSGAKSRIGDDASGMWSNAVGGGLKITKIETPTGRWPANVVFQHLPGCKEAGTKQVKGSQLNQVIHRSQSKSMSIGAQTDGFAHGYTDPLTGTETVTAWACAPGCPVATLDTQSGERPSGGSSTNVPRNVGLYEEGLRRRVITPRTDTGGASRYFKQFVGKPE